MCANTDLDRQWRGFDATKPRSAFSEAAVQNWDTSETLADRLP